MNRTRPDYIYITPAQERYLCVLMNEAFAKRVHHGYMVNDWSRILRSEGSRMITRLRQLLGKETPIFTR